jgi:hypothetical protein
MAVAVRVVDLHLERASRERRARNGGARPLVASSGSIHVELRPAPFETDLERLRAGPRFGAAKLGQQLAIRFVWGTVACLRRGGVEPAEVREIDRARVRQPPDDFLLDVRLDLLRLELAHEVPQEIALGVAFALDLDRRQQITVALGDGEVHADVARDELLELLADRGDEWRVGAEMLGRGSESWPAPRGSGSRFPRMTAWPSGVARGGKSTRVNSRFTLWTTHPLIAMCYLRYAMTIVASGPASLRCRTRGPAGRP